GAERRHPVVVRALLFATLLAACGQRGPAQASSSAPRTEPASAPEAEASATSAIPEASEASEASEPIAAEEPPPDPIAALLAMDGSTSTSVGGPNDGRVEGAVALPSEGPGFRSNPRRPNPDAIWGTVEMVQALVAAAAVVHEEM